MLQVKVETLLAMPHFAFKAFAMYLKTIGQHGADGLPDILTVRKRPAPIPRSGPFAWIRQSDQKPVHFITTPTVRDNTFTSVANDISVS